MNDMLINPVIVICIIIVTSMIVTTLIIKVIPALSKKSKQIENGVDIAKKIVNETGNIIEFADTIMPNNKVIDILQIIELWSKKAVDCAEQLYKASKLEKDQRNDNAKEQIYTIFEVLNIKRTPDIDKIIDGAIEAEVFALGHTPLEMKDMQEEKQALKARNEQLIQENNQFKNAINSLQTTLPINN